MYVVEIKLYYILSFESVLHNYVKFCFVPVVVHITQSTRFRPFPTILYVGDLFSCLGMTLVHIEPQDYITSDF